MTITSQTLPIGRIQQHPENNTRHPDAQIEQLRQSLRTFSYVRTAVVQASADPETPYTIVAGEGIVTAARLEGYTELECRVIPASWPAEKVLAYLVADNELARQSELDDGKTAAILAQLQAADRELVEATGYSDAAVASLIKAAGPGEPRRNGRAEQKEMAGIITKARPSGAADMQEKWQVQPGDLWQLSYHRLICGDSTDTAVIDRLLDGQEADVLLADTPYGKLKLFYGQDGTIGNGHGRVLEERGAARAVQPVAYGEYEGHENFDLKQLLAAVNGRYDSAIIWGGNYFTDVLPVTGSWLVWDKRASDKGQNLFYADCELAWSNLGITAKVFRYIWQGMIREGKQEPRLVPTQKPVPLYEWCIGLCPKEAAVYLDPTVGSGASLLACQNLGKRMLAADISPVHCAVVLERWSQLTGLTPERVI